MLNIKRIFETIADAGQKILEKKSLKKFSKKRDLIRTGLQLYLQLIWKSALLPHLLD